MSPKEELLAELRRNETVLQLFDYEDIRRIWEENRGNVRTTANFVAPTLDAVTATIMLRDLGLHGRAVLKKAGNKTYVIFKGYPGKRKILTAPRYLASNPKVVRLAIGPTGVLKSVKGGAVITAVLFTGTNVFEYFLRDTMKLYELLGQLTSDLVQIGISSLCGAIAGLAVGSATVVGSLAAAPLIAAVAIGVLTGFALTAIDERLGATKALINWYEKMGIELTSTWYDLTSIPDRIAREIYRWEQRLTKQAIRWSVHGY